MRFHAPSSAAGHLSDHLTMALSSVSSALRRTVHPWAWLVVGGGLALLVKLYLAFSTSGTTDVHFWSVYSLYLHGQGGMGLYHDVPVFNHPPFMVHALEALTWITASTSLPFPFLLRLPGILADTGSLVLLWRLFGGAGASTSTHVALALFSVAPVSIMVSGFHGNTDSVMVFFLLLSVVLLEGRCSVWLAGAALGMSMNIKVWPVIFFPAIYAYIPDQRHRIACFSVAAGVFIVASLPYVIQDPALIADRVFRYGSLYGYWGLSRLAVWLRNDGPTLSGAAATYLRLAVPILFGIIVLVSFKMDRLPTKPSLYRQCGVIAFMFMLLTPGFGVQYLAWLVPWVVGADPRLALIFYVPSGLFLFFVYRSWVHGAHRGMPISGGDWGGGIRYLEVLCWISIGVTLLLLLRDAGLFKWPRAVPRKLKGSGR